MLSRHRQDPLEGEDEAPALTKDMSDGLEALRAYCLAAISQRWGPDLGAKLFVVFAARTSVEITCTPARAAFVEAFNAIAPAVGSPVRVTTMTN